MAGASNSKTIKKKKIYHIFLAPPPSLGPWFLNHYTTTPEGGQQSTSQTVATLRSVKLAVLRDPVLGSSSHFVVENSSAPLFPSMATEKESGLFSGSFEAHFMAVPWHEPDLASGFGLSRVELIPTRKYHRPHR